MREEPGSRDLLQAGQALFWSLALAAVAALVALYFIMGDEIQPVLGLSEYVRWPLS